jgi:DNA-binding response OmpR family regulator
MSASPTPAPAAQILVIEEDPAVGQALLDDLRRDQYTVTLETTSAAGIAHARSQPPQLIVLDARLPDASGFDVCRELRRAGLRQPILMLTVRHDEIDRVLGLEMSWTMRSSLRRRAARCVRSSWKSSTT